jgi:hypothetical protein
MAIELNTLNGHDKEIVAKFNEVAKKFDTYGLLEIILNNWCDDGDLEDITSYLSDRLAENGIL